MINSSELRIGNYLMQKTVTRIITTTCTFSHFELLSKEPGSFYPVVLKAEWLEKCGFVENKKYPLLPDAREFGLELPVMGNNKNKICAYIKSNKECFCHATINNLVVSNPVYHLHQLQNLYFALTGQELPVKL